LHWQLAVTRRRAGILVSSYVTTTRRPTAMRPSVNSSTAGSRRPGGVSAQASTGSDANQTGTTSSVFLRPHVYSYTCRGALHMESSGGHSNNDPAKDGGTNDTGTNATKPPGKKSGDLSNDLQGGLPLCRGIATKLRHVTTLPTARSHDEAVQMFQQVLPSTKVVASNDDGAYDRASSSPSSSGDSGHHHDHHSANPTRGYDPNQPLTHSVSCYGSTDVNVLTVQEIETAPVGVEAGRDGAGAGAGAASGTQHGELPLKQQQQQQGFQDPFEAMLGSAFGGALGGGGGSSSSGPGGIFGPFGGFSAGSSSKSVSQSTRVVNGQTITTREVTTVDKNGKRHVEKETTIKNRDGSVEVVKDDDDSGSGKGEGHGQSSRGTSSSEQHHQHSMGQIFPPVASPFGGMPPFGPPHRIVRQSEPQVVAVVPECKLGVTVSNVETDTEGDTIASFRVGPIEVAVGDSYDIVEEEDDSSRQYGDGTATNSANANADGKNGTDRRKKKEWNVDEIEAKLLSTMDKTANSMKKNAEMLSDAMSEDFPSRILKGGERVVGNFENTFDRMTKFATDLYGWASGDGGRK